MALILEEPETFDAKSEENPAEADDTGPDHHMRRDIRVFEQFQEHL